MAENISSDGEKFFCVCSKDSVTLMSSGRAAFLLLIAIAYFTLPNHLV